MNRFRSIFVYLLIIMSVIVILTWAVRPPSEGGSNRQVTEEGPDIAPEWSRWVALGLMSTGIGVSALYIFNMARQGHDLKLAPGETQTQRVVNTAGSNPPPAEPAAKLIRNLEALGFSTLGELDTLVTGINIRTTTWILINADKTIWAHIVLRPGSGRPSLLLASSFKDDALVETRFPKLNLSARLPDYHATAHDTVGKALDYHLAKIQEFANKHGHPVTLSSFEEYADVSGRLSKHIPEFFKRIRRGWIIYGLLLVVPLLCMVQYLVVPPPGYVLSVCAYGGSLFGILVLALGIREFVMNRARK